MFSILGAISLGSVPDTVTLLISKVLEMSSYVTTSLDLIPDTVTHKFQLALMSTNASEINSFQFVYCMWFSPKNLILYYTL